MQSYLYVYQHKIFSMNKKYIKLIKLYITHVRNQCNCHALIGSVVCGYQAEKNIWQPLGSYIKFKDYLSLANNEFTFDFFGVRLYSFFPYPEMTLHLLICISKMAATQLSAFFIWSIKVITKLPNSEQSYKGKVKTHNYINRQNQSTTGKLWKP